MTDHPENDYPRDGVNQDPDSLKPWKTTLGGVEPSMMIFRPRYDQVEHPRSGESFRRLVLDTPDWVNVVARTKNGLYILAKQYRFGTQSMTVEIPGGMVEKGEPHGEGAQRELREETGYTSTRWSYLGSVQPNPAFHNNRCHHWLAEDVELTAPQEMDSGEDIAIVLYSEDQIRAAISSGEIAHALVLTALVKVLDLRVEL
jgi:ADP-ribose pyrophosphatase